jgi:hypothetical protein
MVAVPAQISSNEILKGVTEITPEANFLKHLESTSALACCPFGLQRSHRRTEQQTLVVIGRRIWMTVPVPPIPVFDGTPKHPAKGQWVKGSRWTLQDEYGPEIVSIELAAVPATIVLAEMYAGYEL